MTNCWSTNISVTSSARQPNTFEDAAAQSRLQSSFDHDCQGGKSSGEPWDQLHLRMVYTWNNENTSNWPIQISAKIWTVQEVLWTAQLTWRRKKIHAMSEISKKRCKASLKTCRCCNSTLKRILDWFCNLGNALATVNIKERGQGTAYHTWHSLTMEVQWLIVSSDIDIWQCNS